MRKKASFMLISIILAVLLLYGWTAYAATSPAQVTSASITGAIASVNTDTIKLSTSNTERTVPLAKSVWVFRDEQKALLTDLQVGDQVEIIVNSKQQAAYIQAVSAESAKTDIAQAVNPSPTASAPATPAPTADPSPIPSPSETISPLTPAVTKEPVLTNSAKAQPIYPDLESFEVAVNGSHFKLHIGTSKGSHGNEYDLSIQPENAGMIHLKGDQAAAWIRELFTTIDLKSPDARQILAKQLADHYGLDASKLKVDMKTKWMQNQVPAEPKQQESKENDRAKKNTNKKHDDDDDHEKNEKQRGGNRHD